MIRRFSSVNGLAVDFSSVDVSARCLGPACIPPEGLLMLAGTPDEACVGEWYSWTPTLSGGTEPFTFFLFGESAVLPDGVTLNEETGEVSGTPTEEGDFNFNIQFTDANDNTLVLGPLVLAVADCSRGELELTGTPDPVCNGVAFEFAPETTGGTGPYSYALDTENSDDLPVGLTLNTTTGEITGTTVVDGTYNIILVVADSEEANDTLAFDLVVEGCG